MRSYVNPPKWQCPGSGSRARTQVEPGITRVGDVVVVQVIERCSHGGVSTSRQGTQDTRKGGEPPSPSHEPQSCGLDSSPPQAPVRERFRQILSSSPLFLL